MGGAARFMTLLAAPFPSLRPSLILLRHSVSPLLGWTLSSCSRIKSISPRLVNSFHSQPNKNVNTVNSTASYEQQHHHPWPEWSHFLNAVSSGKGWSGPIPGELKIQPDDAFVVYEELPDDFVLAASTCLAFAHSRPNLLRLLSRRNMEAVVAIGTPFLFKSALECSRRMRAFLETAGSNIPEDDRAATVDLMKYLISYASNPPVSSTKNGLYSRDLVDASVRHLLHELVTVSFAPTGYTPASEHQLSSRYGEVPRPLGGNIEMKRGDWVCPKCNFMNFARNMKCLECEEIRPKKQLTGSEWECPQCNFFNYGKNVVCLRCDCRRPGAPAFNTSSSLAGSGYNGDYTLNNRNAMPLEKADDHYQFGAISPQRTSSNSGNFTDTYMTSDTSMSQSPNNSFVRVTVGPGRDNMGFMSEQNTGTGFSPSISKSGVDYKKKFPDQTKEPVSSDFRNQANISSKAPSIGQNFEFMKNLSIQEKDGDTQGTGEAEKSDSWFKKVKELHKTEDLPSEISDQDIPDLMPIRKGENRFVVSKRKDRSLTSPKYKRQVAMDQASSTNFVPFVPFPPGHFARKETEPPNGLDSPLKAMSDNSSSKTTADSETSVGSNHIVDGLRVASTNDIKPMHSENLELSRKLVDASNLAVNHNQSMSTGTSQVSGHTMIPPLSTPAHGSSTTHKSDNWADTYSGQQNKSQIASPGASSIPLGIDNIRSQWTGKSLEGSAVKEPDPLDMSEEAKAERWFKRVAQIKDISELSQIPDEDFPSIMPMRKGVNRFVVSKRKTPLERRLASQQYRRNLPIVSNEPVKKDSDSS